MITYETVTELAIQTQYSASKKEKKSIKVNASENLTEYENYFIHFNSSYFQIL